MGGISSEAAKGSGYPTNKKKYNGIEETSEFGLNQYDAQLRILDPQIGIWWQVDPETENMEMWSPYTSNYDNPILYKDPLGNAPECCGGLLGALADLGDKITVAVVGVAVGVLHSYSGGSISNNPWGYRDKLRTGDRQSGYDIAVFVGQASTWMLVPAGGGRKVPGANLELVPAGGGPKIKMETPGTPNVIVPRVESSSNQQNGGGKNAQHSNQKARDAAKERYENTRKEYQDLKSKPNKTKEDNQALNTAEKAMKREKQRMDNTGENHSQKAKGSN